MAEKTYITNVETVYQMGLSIFGEDRIQKDGHDSFTIYFPEIDIRNSNGYLHRIRDLFIKLKLFDTSDSTMRLGLDMTGARTTFTLKEFQSGYGHSHLSGAPFSWGGWCLGASNFNTIRNNLMIQPTEDNWMLFLLGLPRYLQWESIEGGPYHLMEHISFVNSRRNNLTDEQRKEIYKNIYRLDVRHWSIPKNLDHENPYIISSDSIVEYLRDWSAIKNLNSLSLQGQKNIIKSIRTPPVINWKGTILKGTVTTCETSEEEFLSVDSDLAYIVKEELQVKCLTFLKNIANKKQKQIHYAKIFGNYTELRAGRAYK